MILVAGDHKNSGTQIAWDLLKAGKNALDATEQGIRAVEANLDDWSVGMGGYPNALGVMELDAGVMDGRNRISGAVAGLQGVKHPVTVAYAVMRRLPHVLLVGEGAARFAQDIHAEKAQLMTDHMNERWRKWCRKWGIHPETGDGNLIDAVWQGKDPQIAGGTTIYLAQDANGDICASTSTSGWAWKYPGRVGDTPIAGAGFYADNRYGAAACTGAGELAIRTGLARITVLYMKQGMSVEEAVREALQDVIELQATTKRITLYAIDTQGNYFVGRVQDDESDLPEYYVARDGDDSPQVFPSVRIG